MSDRTGNLTLNDLEGAAPFILTDGPCVDLFCERGLAERTCNMRGPVLQHCRRPMAMLSGFWCPGPVGRGRTPISHRPRADHARCWRMRGARPVQLGFRDRAGGVYWIDESGEVVDSISRLSCAMMAGVV